ncbi:1-(5-phosphoribosyl)-5-[(5-phosphoribosylamino)methylideneamino]imidazole-4-carboxamide isomerase [Glaciecola petra]|uniref:1-(5-phosphoribosyl)-5-[(5-phosphoribosylamino)methylideneamino] imidazole-4-carboxamide isomerase n=1 Tax=Glaciecola petra TaxID=3075602 RepID=A0ABU2ZQ32_9ALTE|nr:1-(5-phosphoribosyl)-5-[(5-phosphoribosylamino)methylideneamino]imidazole-4-carboxamide isomerase [Aestuariibacter sp. P117]MDT0594738.1 1-(5-phosphoribosyl)-5-[(5-phosphoribosylamino)methylideneamino]imidazole-4-carboxamide isomerase [Aestuariibacter sp. P117]
MLIPAIDLIEGNVVRLYQGDYKQKTQYELDPVEVVKLYASQGAEILHIVDLTGAKDPSKRQIPLIKKMIATGLMRFQAGGGIRTKQDVLDLLNAGVERVVIGSLAVSDTETVTGWFKEFGPDKIVLALDINIDEHGNKFVATHGWQNDSGVSIDDLITLYRKCGLKHVLCTDISRDGTLQGANHSLYQSLVRTYQDIQWQASGGIGNLDDINALKPSKVQAVILGRSLLEGKFTLEEAIKCWQDV